MACEETEFKIAEMIGKSVFSNDDIIIGKITKIIDQSDSDKDDPNKICDIEKDLFQVVTELSPDVFPALKEPTEILFSSQTLDSVVADGIKLKLTKDNINATIESSLG